MRTIPLEYITDPDDDDCGMVKDIYVCVDWKANPETVADALNRQLAEHGLEIVMAESGDDEFYFKVVGIEKS